ncbi:IS701 family transposase [Streptomyces anulatus]|uniref:IS701 family transposase n=1 Tax=Streptomyces anulatus TaxID=1892 RepID=UPI00386B4C7E
MISEVECWKAELELALARVAGRFGRADLRWRMRDYVRGLLAPVGRKNGWQLAEWAGHRDPAGLQHLLNGARWDADAVRDDVRDYVAERLGPGGVLIIDDTGFVKKGTTSAGVGRQYTGTSGKIDNCQIGVFAACATSSGRALVDRELYLPKAWTSDPERCRAAKIPDERGFATKWELAREIVRRCLAAGLLAARVTANEAYGQDWNFRRLLEQLGLGYIVAVPKSQQIKSLAGCWRIDQLIDETPADAWQRLSCGDGAKGPRVYDWAAAKLPANIIFDPDPPTHRRWVLARRSLSDPTDIAYHLAHAPVGIEIDELARIAGSRWAVEECFQAAKNECGLDEYEVRRYPGWYRHITLAMLAHAFLTALAAQAAYRESELPRVS